MGKEDHKKDKYTPNNFETFKMARALKAIRSLELSKMMDKLEESDLPESSLYYVYPLIKRKNRGFIQIANQYNVFNPTSEDSWLTIVTHNKDGQFEKVMRISYKDEQVSGGVDGYDEDFWNELKEIISDYRKKSEP